MLSSEVGSLSDAFHSRSVECARWHLSSSVGLDSRRLFGLSAERGRESGPVREVVNCEGVLLGIEWQWLLKTPDPGLGTVPSARAGLYQGREFLAAARWVGTAEWLRFARFRCSLAPARMAGPWNL